MTVYRLDAVTVQEPAPLPGIHAAPTYLLILNFTRLVRRIALESSRLDICSYLVVRYN